MLKEFPIKIFDFYAGNLNSSLLNFSLKTDNKKVANVPMNALAASKPPAASLQVRAKLTLFYPGSFHMALKLGLSCIATFRIHQPSGTHLK
jgi:hypothetical protein